MKIAISLFGNKVSPRFDLSPELWIITEKNGEVVRQEKISLENFNISQRIEMLALTGVAKMVCGGIHDFRLDQLRNMGIDVFHNVIGEADIALGNLLKGQLRPGSLCEEKRKGDTVQAKRTARA
jgi:predicted Fe-Mo cluster-binding NifX family protein